jgi:hypothetical protein
MFSLVRCCFVAPFTRAEVYAKNKLNSDKSFKEASSIDYPFGSDTIIHIPGIVRYIDFISNRI